MSSKIKHRIFVGMGILMSMIVLSLSFKTVTRGIESNIAANEASFVAPKFIAKRADYLRLALKPLVGRRRLEVYTGLAKEGVMDHYKIHEQAKNDLGVASWPIMDSYVYSVEKPGYESFIDGWLLVTINFRDEKLVSYTVDTVGPP